MTKRSKEETAEQQIRRRQKFFDNASQIPDEAPAAKAIWDRQQLGSGDADSQKLWLHIGWEIADLPPDLGHEVLRALSLTILKKKKLSAAMAWGALDMVRPAPEAGYPPANLDPEIWDAWGDQLNDRNRDWLTKGVQ